MILPVITTEHIKTLLSFTLSIASLIGFIFYAIRALYEIAHLSYYELFAIPYNEAFKKKVASLFLIYLFSILTFTFAIIPGHDLHFILKKFVEILIINSLIFLILVLMMNELFKPYGKIYVELHKFDKPETIKVCKDNNTLIFLNMLSDNKMSVASKISDEGIPENVKIINLSNVDWFSFKSNINQSLFFEAFHKKKKNKKKKVENYYSLNWLKIFLSVLALIGLLILILILSFFVL